MIDFLHLSDLYVKPDESHFSLGQATRGDKKQNQ